MTVEFNLQKGLIGHWTMDGKDTSSGILYDRSGYGNHGNISGALSVGSPGIINESYTFSDSNNGTVEIGTGIIGVGDVSLSGWFNMTKSDGGDIMNFQGDIKFIVDAGGRVNGDIAIWVGSWEETGVSFQTGVWNHIAVVYDDNVSNIKLYLNNTLEYEYSDSTEAGTGTGVTIGADDSGSRRFDGRLDSIRVYNRPLSKSEISAMYNMRSQRKQNLKTNVTYNDTQQLYNSQGHAGTTSEMDEFFNLSNSDVTNILSTKHERSSVNHGSSDQSTSEFGTVNSLPKYFTKEDGYSWKIEGKWTAPETGTYTFGIDGDDAMDFLVDGNPVVTFYGGHGFDGTVDNNSGTITLTAGERYNVAFRYEEGSGGNGATLGYKKPSDSNYVLFPVQQVF